MDINTKLKEFEAKRNENWQGIIFVLRKHLDNWAHDKITPNWGQMKMSYMPVICNISVDGTSAIEISRSSMIAKQAMSRTIKELEEKGMITSNKDTHDKRVERLYLTESGKHLVYDANVKLDSLIEEYVKLVGKKDFDIAVGVIQKIIRYHEQEETLSKF